MVKKSIVLAGIAAAAIGLAGVKLVRGGDEGRRAADPKEGAIVMTADSLDWKEVKPGASVARLWGDLERGPYGSFTKFKPGFKCALHHHSSDMRIVVIKGAYILVDEDGTERRVGPGSYAYEPAGHRHMTLADEKEGCLFYNEGSGKFDVIEEENRPERR